MTTTAIIRPSNLPAELSSFVGRRREIVELRASIDEHRLVTLVGPGGVGKTRLALHAAREIARDVTDGPWLVQLAGVVDPELIADQMLADLGLRDTRSGTAIERLTAHLADRRTLIVLDNCEHVRDAAAALTSDLLRACPDVRILTTTRHLLSVVGEHVVPVRPLSLPAEGAGLEAISDSGAVELFVERATASHSSFELTAANAPAVAELVRRLDGVPLAIELAAVRVRLLTPEQILARLEDRFTLLSQGDRSAASRQHSLRALIDWSHDLLSEPEQEIWARASVFQGSFDLAAIQALCAGERSSTEVLLVVEDLVSKSIFESREHHGRQRFVMLSSLREYGAERLAEAGDTANLQARHRTYYLALVSRARRELYGERQAVWHRRLGADHGNLRAVLESCAHDPAHADEGLRMMGDLLHPWVMTGRFSEARHWADRLLGNARPDSLERAIGLVVTGRMAVLQGDRERAAQALAEALDIARATGVATWEAAALHGLGIAELFWGDSPTAVGLLEQALDRHRFGDDPLGTPLALVHLATAHGNLGEYDEALRCADEVIRLSEVSYDTWCAGLAEWTKAHLTWTLGRTAEAVGHARRTLELKKPFGDRLGIALSMEIIAWGRAAGGRHDEGAQLLGASMSALRSVGADLFSHLVPGHDAAVASCRSALGEARFQRELDTGAGWEFDRALSIALGETRLQDPPSAAVVLSRRESQIAELIAEGLTNREIAERLFISQRTAEGHVDRTMKKLGVTSRAQIAAWAAAHRPPV